MILRGAVSPLYAPSSSSTSFAVRVPPPPPPAACYGRSARYYAAYDAARDCAQHGEMAMILLLMCRHDMMMRGARHSGEAPARLRLQPFNIFEVARRTSVRNRLPAAMPLSGRATCHRCYVLPPRVSRRQSAT